MAHAAHAPCRPAGLLLTGGASRRMGQDKAAMVVGGRQLASRTAELLTAFADPVIEVGPGYTQLTSTREEPAGSGPLAALAAGVAALRSLAPRDASDAHPAAGGARAKPALVVATDLPNLTAGMLRLLAEHPAPGCVVPLDATGRAQPACARYSAEALALAPVLVAAGRRSLMALLDQIALLGQVPTTWLAPTVWVGPAGRPDVLVDLDTPQDLSALEARR